MKQIGVRWLILSLIVVALIGFFVYRPKEEPVITEPPQTVSEMIDTGPHKVTSENVLYTDKTIGFYAYPETDGDYPGVVMIHEWWGMNDSIKDMAKKLASYGYRVLAVDLFSGKVAQNMQQAQAMISAVAQAKANTNMADAKKFLIDKGSKKIAVFGWCYGGGQSLQFSLAEKDLSATVIYYGQLVTDSNKLKNITWPVLGIFGDTDTSISVDSVKAFEAALNKNQTPSEIIIYTGVGHAFANPTGPNYAPAETIDAWERTIVFLKKYLP